MCDWNIVAWKGYNLRQSILSPWEKNCPHWLWVWCRYLKTWTAIRNEMSWSGLITNSLWRVKLLLIWGLLPNYWIVLGNCKLFAVIVVSTNSNSLPWRMSSFFAYKEVGKLIIIILGIGKIKFSTRTNDWFLL